MPIVFLPKEIFIPFSSCGKRIMPNKYSVNENETNIQIPIKVSLFKIPQCITKSAFDKNLKANATSTNASIFFTTSNQLPDFGNDCNQCGKIANNAKGNASANPKPVKPAVNCHAPPLNELTNSEPKIGPVQENETITNVSAMKNIPPVLPNPLFESALLAILPGNVISKYPKNEIAKMMKMIKKVILSQGLVDILLKISGCTFPSK